MRTYQQKFPISWHEEGLANSRLNLADKVAQLMRLQADIDRHQADVDFTAAQIAEARLRGLTEFDPSRFMKPNAKP